MPAGHFVFQKGVLKLNGDRLWPSAMTVLFLRTLFRQACVSLFVIIDHRDCRGVIWKMGIEYQRVLLLWKWHIFIEGVIAWEGSAAFASRWIEVLESFGSSMNGDGASSGIYPGILLDIHNFLKRNANLTLFLYSYRLRE
jgi:hypothetical protein